jgi:hypothetical protein
MWVSILTSCATAGMLYHKFNYRLIEIIVSYFKRQRTSGYTECSAAKLTVFAISQHSIAFFTVLKNKIPNGLWRIYGSYHRTPYISVWGYPVSYSISNSEFEIQLLINIIRTIEVDFVETKKIKAKKC